MAAIMEINRVIIFHNNEQTGRIHVEKHDNQINVLFDIGSLGKICVYGQYYTKSNAIERQVLDLLMLDWSEALFNAGYNVSTMVIKEVPFGLMIITQLNS